jgi:tetratricopeptide (TPR) repeat protein
VIYFLIPRSEAEPGAGHPVTTEKGPPAIEDVAGSAGKIHRPDFLSSGAGNREYREPASMGEPALKEIPDRHVADEQNHFRDRENLEFLSRFYFKQKQYSQALKGFLELVKTDGGFAVLCGQCYFFMEEYGPARSSLLEAIRWDPDDFQARKFLALTCYRLDQFDDSLKFAKEALALRKDPELREFHLRLLREMEAMKGYTDRKTPGFKIIFSQFEHGDIRFRVTGILKEAFRQIGKKMNHYPDRAITVILYNEKGFFDITRAPEWAGGLYDGKIRIPIKGAGGREALLKRVLYHEYTHALIHDLTPRCPLWLNEGLAEYFSSEHQKKVGQIIPLQLLEARFPGGDPRLVAAAYLESYSAVSYLISKFGFYRLKELLTETAKAKDFATAFETVFHENYRDFLGSWGKG